MGWSDQNVLRHLREHPRLPMSLHQLRRQLRADLVLLLVTAIWGTTFVMVKDAVASTPVFTFLAIRFILASAAMLPLLTC